MSHMWMELALPMAAQIEGTFGHLQVQPMKPELMVIGVPAQRQILLSLEPYHHLLEMITSVTLAVVMLYRTNSTTRTLCGMGKDVAQPAPAASSTLLPTSVKSSFRQPLMTLK